MTPKYLQYAVACPSCISAQPVFIPEGHGERECKLCFNPHLRRNTRIITKTVPYVEGMEMLKDRRQ